jgi:hypothetical protein
MKGILRIAFKLLVNDRGKFAALLVGLTFAVFLMVQVTSVFAGILKKASASVINVGARIWVMDPAVDNPLNSIPFQYLFHVFPPLRYFLTIPIKLAYYPYRILIVFPK